ncbi:MAG: FG-GAP-like repeat-containing protein, partial [Candidatus Omnitrophota bacterium]
MKKLKIALFVVSAAISLFSLKDKAVVTTAPGANLPVAEAYHAPAWMQPKPVSVENLISPSTVVKTPQQVSESSPFAEFAEPDILSQESYILGKEPAKPAAADTTSKIEAETPSASGASSDAPATIIYGFADTGSTSDTSDGESDAGTTNSQPVLTQAAANTVSITGLMPNSGIPDTDIIIQGAGFSSTASSNDVKFGSVSSTSVTYVSANQLRATIPQSGVSPGFTNVSVTVDSVTSNNALFSVLKSSAGNVFDDNTQALLPGGLTLADSSIVRLGDVDNDNDMDLFIIDVFTGAAYLLINNGQGVFTNETSSRLLSTVIDPSSITDAVFGDVDKDSYPDILLTYSSGQSIRLLSNDGHGKFSDTTASNLPLISGEAAGLDLGDSNGDGSPDIVIANKNIRDIVLINNGTGTFSLDANFNLPAIIDGSSDIHFCDADGDGDVDIITTNNIEVGASSLSNRIYLNNGSGVFTDATESLLPADNEYSEVLDYGDIDSDGDIDIIVANDSQNAVLIYTGGGVFEDQAGARLPPNYFASKDTKLGDINGDGHLDIVMLGSDRTSLLINDGQGLFSGDASIKLPDYKSIPAVVGGKNIQAADINGDGSLDIIIGGENLRILMNAASNKAPVLEHIGSKTVQVGNTLIFNINASDPNGDPFTFVTDYFPNGATFSSINKIFSWAPTPDDIGDRSVRFVVREDTQAALEDSEDVIIKVIGSGLPVIDYYVPDELDLELAIGQIVQFGIHATDPDGKTLTFKWFLNGVEIPAGSGATSSMIFIVPRIGNNTVEVKVSNSFGTSSLLWNLTVGTTQNHSPIITSYNPNQSIVNIDLSAGGGFGFGVTATDPDLDILSYTWKFNNITLPSSGADLSSSAFIGSVGAAGDYPLEVSVSDGHNSAVTHSWTIHVTQGPANHAPVAANDTATINMNTAADIDVLSNDTDADLNP